MNKNVLIFLGGVAVGVGCTALWVAKKLVPELREEATRKAQEDIYTFPDYSEYLNDEEEEKKPNDEEPSAPPASEMKAQAQANRTAPAVDYSKYAPKTEKKVEENPARRLNENIPAPQTDIERGIEEPYLIDRSEFDIRGDYRAHSYTIYANGVVVDDETDETLDIDPEKKFGKTAVEELKKGDIVYVRDEANKYDYRIEQSDFDYEPPDDDDDWGP